MGIIEFNTEAGTGIPLKYFNYFKVPPKAVQIRLCWVFSGNPLEITFKQVKFREVDPKLTPWNSCPRRVKQIIHRSLPELSDKQVAEILKKMPRRKPKLERNGDPCRSIY